MRVLKRSTWKASIRLGWSDPAAIHEKSRLTRCVNCGRNPTAGYQIKSQRKGNEGMTNRRTPRFDKKLENIYSARGQRGFRVEVNLFTRMKTEKTGSVNTDGAK